MSRKRRRGWKGNDAYTETLRKRRRGWEENDAGPETLRKHRREWEENDAYTCGSETLRKRRRGWDAYTCGPGTSVIINNMKFKRSAPLPGGIKGEENLRILFTVLGFEVHVHRNHTATEIINLVKTYQSMEHKGAFFLIVLSHGNTINNNVVVLGTDEMPVEVQELEAHFHFPKCPSLEGMPKIFMIDACRGGKLEVNKSFWSRAPPNKATECGDVGIIYASSPGKAAVSTQHKGSVLTQTFCEVAKEANEDDNLGEIVRRVRRRIKDTRGARVQTVEFVDRLYLNYFIQRRTVLPMYNNLSWDYHQHLKQWIEVQSKAIESISEATNGLKAIANAGVSGFLGFDTSFRREAVEEAKFKMIQQELKQNHISLEKAVEDGYSMTEVVRNLKSAFPNSEAKLIEDFFSGILSLHCSEVGLEKCQEAFAVYTGPTSRGSSHEEDGDGEVPDLEGVVLKGWGWSYKSRMNVADDLEEKADALRQQMEAVKRAARVKYHSVV